MSNIRFCYINLWDSGTITYTTQHYNFPGTNSQNRRLTSPWRSGYEESIGGGYFEITASNQELYFNEGAGSFTASISIGDYNVDSLLTEIESKMEAAGAHGYTVTYDFDTFKFLITDVTGTFELEGATTANAIWSTLGYDESDTGLAASHEADSIRIHTFEYIQSSLAAETAFDYLAIFNCNVQTTGTLKWQFSNDDFVTIDLEVSPTRNGRFSAHLFSTAQTYRYCRIYIEDIDNPDGYVQVGKAAVCESFLPEIGYAPGASLGSKDKSIMTESLSGETMSVQYPHVATRNYKFDVADPFETFTVMHDLVGTTMPLIILTRSNLNTTTDFDNPELYSLYCRISQYNPRNIAGNKYSLTLAVQELK